MDILPPVLIFCGVERVLLLSGRRLAMNYIFRVLHSILAPASHFSLHVLE
jgi:hypothetical protein